MTRHTADAVACTGLAYAFADTNAVDGVDLTVREGEVFGLLGPNGAGKTTAIRCMTTLLPVPAGMVRVFGHDAADDRMAVRRLLGYVPQQLSADASLTGRENVALFARVFDVPRRERAARVARPSPPSASPTPPTGSPAPTPAAWSAGSNSPRPWSALPVC